VNGLHHQLGVLAKESSVLSHISHDRFELGVGAGDWPASFRAWGMRFIIEEALDTAQRSPRPMTVSVFTDRSWDGWPPDPSAAIASWADRGVERCFISVGGPDTADRIRMLAAVADPR